MVSETEKTIEYVWEDLQERIEYESTAITTSEDEYGELTVLTIEFGNNESCEIVSHTVNEDTVPQTVQEILFYHADGSVNSFEDKTIEQTINIVVACYPEFDIIN